MRNASPSSAWTKGDSLRRRFEEEQEGHHCSASAVAGLFTTSGSARWSRADLTRLVCRPLPGPEEPNKDESAASLYIVRESEIYSPGLGGCVIFPGRLRERSQFWQGIGVSSFVMSVIRDGFRLPLLAVHVPQTKVMSNHGSCVKHDQFVDEAVSELLASKCVREVSWEEGEVCSPLDVHDSGKKTPTYSWLKAGPPWDYFSHRWSYSLNFFVWKLLKKYEKWHAFCADAQWWSPWRRKNVEKGTSLRRI